MSIASKLILLAGIALLAATAVAGSIARQTARLPDLPSPPQGEAQWIAPSMRLNGLPMTLKSFSSRLAPDAVLQYFESWAGSRSHHETLRTRQGEWRTLAIRATDYDASIQVRSSHGGSEGTITVSSPIAATPLQTSTRFPRPADDLIVNWQEYEDDGIEAEHISLSSQRSISVEAHSYSQHLQRAGWQIIRQQNMSESGVHVIEAQHGAQQARLVFMKERSLSGTSIVIIWRKS